ncbi:MAG: hypothetical protein ACRCUJ_06585 [Phocaeicola sp.]
MSYIDLINQFWKIQETEDFSPNEVMLYFYLLKECNLRGWPNKFEYPNKKIVLATGISEPTVIACRCRLQQKGILEFEAGKRNAKSPTYYLNGLSKPLSKPLSKTLSKPLSKTLSLNKDLRDKSKDNTPKPPTVVKGGGINSKARKLFEEHFTSLFGEPYYWVAKDSGGMSQIINKLKFQREQKQLPNEDEEVLNALKVFLGTITDGWIYSNFSVSNINSKFNEIISKAKDKHGSKTNQRASATDARVQTISNPKSIEL